MPIFQGRTGGRLGLVAAMAAGLAMGAAGGCCPMFPADFQASLSGYVGKSDGAASSLTLVAPGPMKDVPCPDIVIAGATVEMWTPEGKELLCRQPSTGPEGLFSVSTMKKRTPGYRYLIRASAPGYATFEEVVVLDPDGGARHAIIRLAPEPAPALAPKVSPMESAAPK